MENVLIVGAGGVGSWLAWFLNNYIKNNQFDTTKISITFADKDTVDFKNLTYQKFDMGDILDNKATVIHNKYNFNAITKEITSENELKNYNCIVSAVDNTTFRNLLFNYVFNVNTNTYWIDLRSEGRTVAAYAKNEQNTYKTMLATMPKTEVREASCQLKYELEAGIVQGGNQIIAAIGAQMLLNWYRNVYNSAKFLKRF